MRRVFLRFFFVAFFIRGRGNTLRFEVHPVIEIDPNRPLRFNVELLTCELPAVGLDRLIRTWRP